MTSLDGEYMLLGRKTEDTSNIFVQYGQGPTRTVNVTGGQGRQEAEFVDGLRFSLESTQPFKLNAGLKTGIDGLAIPAGFRSLSKFSVCTLSYRVLSDKDSFVWVVNTTQTQDMTADILFPGKCSETGVLHHGAALILLSYSQCSHVG